MKSSESLFVYRPIKKLHSAPLIITFTFGTLSIFDSGLLFLHCSISTFTQVKDLSASSTSECQETYKQLKTAPE